MRSWVDGPQITTGNTNTSQNFNPEAGPSLVFQGGMMYDFRFAASAGAAPGLPGTKDYGVYCPSYVVGVDGVPQTKTTALIAAAQAAASGVAMTLASTLATGRSLGIPIVPWSGGLPTKVQASSAVNCLALDFGFATCSINTGTPNVTGLPTGAWKYLQQKGQWVIITGAGASAALPLIAQISVPPAINGTTMTLDRNAGTTATSQPIGNADPTGVAAWPFYAFGTGIGIHNPSEMIARAVSITGNAGSAAGNFTVVGYDVWGNPQTETIAFAGGAATTNGKKAFKFIVSVTPAFTDAGHTFSVDTTDIFGFPLRNDFWEYTEVFFNGAFVTANTGWLAADTTNPQTATSGDPKGTYAVQSASDGTKRLALFTNIPPQNLINANNLDIRTVFGNTPA